MAEQRTRTCGVGRAPCVWACARLMAEQRTRACGVVVWGGHGVSAGGVVQEEDEEEDDEEDEDDFIQVLSSVLPHCWPH